MIDSFSNEYHFLSNFHLCKIRYQGILYPSVEHAYQAAKTLDEGRRQKIAAIYSPAYAKRAGQVHELRPDWDNIKVDVMRELVRIKFSQHADLRRKLLATGDQALVEGNYWNDRFWGVCKGAGQNWLGRILMEIRAELRKGEEPMIIAGIGTREPTEFQADAAYKLGRFLVANGHTLKSGGAVGIDQCFARGGNSVDPTKVVVCVPWESYEAEARHPKNQLLIVGQMPSAHQLALAAEAAKHHPVWVRLSQGAQKLMIRNGLIIDQCDLVLACPSPRGGGTRQGMVVGESRGIKVVDFSNYDREQLSGICQRILQA